MELLKQRKQILLVICSVVKGSISRRGVRRAGRGYMDRNF